MKKNEEKYNFELFCIDSQEVNNERGLVRGLCFSSSLWGGNEPRERREKGLFVVEEAKSKISIHILNVDTSKVVTDYLETAFILRASSTEFKSLVKFRLRLLHHLKSALEFNHLRILADDISTEIANRLYPKINRVESLLRRYLTKFFIQRVGLNWWDVTATRNMVEKVNYRKGFLRDEFHQMVAMDVHLVDFDDLGELIYKQTSGFNNPEAIVSRLLGIADMDELQILQSELQGNYTKYFKEFFRDKNFEAKWKELYKIRNKVAHHGTFYGAELERGDTLCSDLARIITDAEKRIDEIVLSIEDKEAILDAVNANIEASRQEVEAVSGENENGKMLTVSDTLPRYKVLGKIDLPASTKRIHTGPAAIDEQELLEELREAQEKPYNNYVGLKWFVTTHCANRGYSINSSYSLVNVLIDRGKIELYEIPSPQGYSIKAIRLPA